MKKACAILFCLLLSCLSHASTVSQSRAEEVARRVLNTDRVVLASTTTGHYIFNSASDGWVIVSSDDSVAPVLAYSHEGHWTADPISPAAEYWLSKTDSEIDLIRSAGVKQSERIRAEWSAPMVRTKAEYGEWLLETANWNQTPQSYGKLCPLYDETKNTYAGCVAVSMSIVMRYHKWPLVGKDTTDSYNTSHFSVPAITLEGYEFNWDSMPTTDADKASPAWHGKSLNAVAALMYYAGASIQMNYSPVGSSAYPKYIAGAMRKYFSYGESASHKQRSSYTDDEWLSLIQKDISANHPVIYSGGGHCFICDGCNSKGYLHINWGWGGVSNGWFAISYLYPDDKTNYSYSSGESAVFSLIPDKDPSSSGFPELSFNSIMTVNGIKCNDARIFKNVPFTLSIGNIINNDKVIPFNGTIRAALMDCSGNVKQWLGSPVNVSIAAGATGNDGFSTQAYACTIDTDILVGDYICVFAFDSTGNKSYIIGTQSMSCVSHLSVVPLTTITVPNEVSSECILYPSYAVGVGKAAVNFSTWYIDGKKISTSYGYVIPSVGEHTLKLEITYSDGVTETIQKKISAK